MSTLSQNGYGTLTVGMGYAYALIPSNFDKKIKRDTVNQTFTVSLDVY